MTSCFICHDERPVDSFRQTTTLSRRLDGSLAVFDIVYCGDRSNCIYRMERLQQQSDQASYKISEEP